MNKKELKRLIRGLDEKAEIVIVDSIGSEFPIDRVEQREDKIVVVLKRSYKNTDNEPLPLKLETDRYEKN